MSQPTEPTGQPDRSTWWPRSAFESGARKPAPDSETRRPVADAASRSVPRWLFVAVAAVLAAIVGALGFVTPGYFVTTVLDQVAVQDGVRTVLERDYRLLEVTDVVCPPNQRVAPARTFVCTVQIDGVPLAVPVVIQDREGRYAVGRP